jgi:hypothetical protein
MSVEAIELIAVVSDYDGLVASAGIDLGMSLEAVN